MSNFRKHYSSWMSWSTRQGAGEDTLNEEFKKDINWFHKYLAGTNSIFMINQDDR